MGQARELRPRRTSRILPLMWPRIIKSIWECLDQANQWHAIHAHSRVSLEECRLEIQSAHQEEPGY